MVSEAKKQMEELCEVEEEYQSILLSAVSESGALRRVKRRRLYRLSEIERNKYYPSKAVIDLQYEIYIEDLEKQEKINALENGKEDLPKDIDPEDELHLKKQDEIQSTKSRHCRNIDPRYELFIEHLKKQEKINPLEDGKGYLPKDNDSQNGLNLKQDRIQSTERRNCRDLKRREKIYARKNEEEGLPVYREKEDSHKPGNLNYVKKLRSFAEPTKDSERFHRIENHCKRDQKPVYSKRTERTKNLSSPKTEKKANGNTMNDRAGLRQGGVIAEHEKKHGMIVTKQEKNDDDVKILDKTTFYKMTGLSPIPMGFNFRQEVISLLRKPYDEGEHEKLWFDVTRHLAKERHREMRKGRDGPCKTVEDAKSYLDNHPGFRKKLERFRDDKPKCLNLLRGFFFWLQKCSRNGSFSPWMDSECLATYPNSR